MRAEVLSNIEVAPSYFHLTLSCPEFPFPFEPGQFVMLRLGKGFDPLLPRPFSIYRRSGVRGEGKFTVHGSQFTEETHRFNGGSLTSGGPEPLASVRRGESAISHQPSAKDWRGPDVEIIYKVVGKATGLMAGMGPGAKLELLGPLGKGFQVPAYLKTAILVAGGIGVPPLVALAESLGVRGEGGFRVHGSGFTEETHRFNGGSLTSEGTEPLASARGKRPRLLAFLGGKAKEDVLCIKDFERLGARIYISTEDGSLGFRGLVTEILKNSLPSAISHQPSAVYACGPHLMLAEVAAIASKHRIPCQVSLEAMMACGIGACMGCATPVHSSQFTVQRREKTVNRQPSTVNQQSYKLVCKDGPVFDAREIEW